jgi:hypothetical protein
LSLGDTGTPFPARYLDSPPWNYAALQTGFWGGDSLRSVIPPAYNLRADVLAQLQ